MNSKDNDNAIRVMSRGGRMTQEPLYPEGHPKRIKQDSQRNNIDAPSSSKKKKKKNDRTVQTSSEPIAEPPDNPNDISMSDAETQLPMNMNQMKMLMMMFIIMLNLVMIMM